MGRYRGYCWEWNQAQDGCIHTIGCDYFWDRLLTRMRSNESWILGNSLFFGFIKASTSVNVQGSSGNTLLEYFDSKGGAQAYLGSCYPGFPNLFTLFGKLFILYRLLDGLMIGAFKDPILQLDMRLWFLVKNPRSAYPKKRSVNSTDESRLDFFSIAVNPAGD